MVVVVVVACMGLDVVCRGHRLSNRMLLFFERGNL